MSRLWWSHAGRPWWSYGGLRGAPCGAVVGIDAQTGLVRWLLTGRRVADAVGPTAAACCPVSAASVRTDLVAMSVDPRA